MPWPDGGTKDGEMKHATPALVELARRLLEQETKERPDGRDLADAAEQVAQKLRLHLVQLVGPAGFQALLARALTLARAGHPFLKGVEAATQAETSLAGLGAAVQGRDQAEIEAGVVAMVAGLLWLLATFIGEDLTGRLVHAVWPQVPLGNLGSDSEEVQR